MTLIEFCLQLLREMRIQSINNTVLQLWNRRELIELEYQGNGVYGDPVNGATVTADITEGKVLWNEFKHSSDTCNYSSTVHQLYNI